MKKTLIDDGLFDYDKILVDDKARSVCIFEKENIKFVMKLGNHAARNDTTKYKLLRNEDKIYMALQRLDKQSQAYFPQIIDAGSSDDKFYYIIMEYVNGQTLYDYLTKAYANRNKSKVNTNDLLTIMLNFTRALKALWSQQIVHGDLSIENVMIEPNLNVKLIDFEKSSTSLKLAVNTVGSSHLNINNKSAEGLGYFYLLVKIANASKDISKFRQLLTNIKTVLAECTDCQNVYADCESWIKLALTDTNTNSESNSTSGGRKSRARSRKNKRKTRRV
jgi:serine/threonine protein kinase